MRFLFCMTLSFLFWCNCLFAQRKGDGNEKSFDAGLNITSTLAGFFNSGGQDLPKDPFLLSLRLVGEHNIYRMGLNFRVDVSEEGLASGFRETTENEVQLRLGKEWRQPVTRRFTLYYGIDAVGSWELDKSSFQAFPDILRSREETFGIGGGPFLGVLYQIHERIYLSTESYAYGIYYSGDKFTDLGAPLPPEDAAISRFSLQPAIPNSLYINVRF